MSAELKGRVFDAVQAELLDVGIDRFSIDGVARRAGVDPGAILANWHDRRVLLMEVMLARTAASVWNPDSGSLYSDLEAVSQQAVSLSQTASGRAMFRRVLPGGDSVDLAEISSDLWTARFRDAAQILKRAADRGQLRDGILPQEAIRMFAAAFYYDVIFSDVPVRPEYGEQVIDIFLHGVLGAAGRDRPWLDVEHLLQQPDADHGVVDQAVEAARRAVVLMRVWADALPDPVVLYEAVRDDEGRIIDFRCRDLNRATCEEVGLPRHDLIGRTVTEALPVFAASGLLERYAHCVDTGEPLVLNDFSYLHFDEQRRLDIRVSNAGAELITVTWRDVTDRFESAQRDERYRKLMDYSAVPAVLTTPDGRFVSVNQAMATLMGYDIDTLLTMTWQDLTAPETIAEELQVVADMLAGRRNTYRAIKQYVHFDGYRIWADLSVSCVRRPDGEVEHLIAQIVDVTAYVGGDVNGP
jgi:PAS domain S-box-containing protein